MDNQRILLTKRPHGLPDESHFKIEDIPVPEISEGQVLVKTLYLSVDPYMRGRMDNAKSYVAPFEVGEPFNGGIVGEVERSATDDFAQGDIVFGNLDWQRYIAASGDNLRKVDPSQASITTALGVAGMPGITAYFGLLDIGRPKEGETVVVSGAAGAVGSVVGQIAKIKGCRVVGIAGSEKKIAHITEDLGFDVGINYKTTDNMKQAVREAAPNGVDIYYDNVGGETSDAVMKCINGYARIVVCGQIALYNVTEVPTGPRVQPSLIKKSALMQGFTVGDYADRMAEGAAALTKWIAEDKIKYTEHVIEDFEKTPDAFLGLFRGENIGKQLVKVADRSY